MKKRAKRAWGRIKTAGGKVARKIRNKATRKTRVLKKPASKRKVARRKATSKRGAKTAGTPEAVAVS